MFQFEVPPEYRDRGAIAIGALHFFIGKACTAEKCLLLKSPYMRRPCWGCNAFVVVLQDVCYGARTHSRYIYLQSVCRRLFHERRLQTRMSGRGSHPPTSSTKGNTTVRSTLTVSHRRHKFQIGLQGALDIATNVPSINPTGATIAATPAGVFSRWITIAHGCAELILRHFPLVNMQLPYV